MPDSSYWDQNITNSKPVDDLGQSGSNGLSAGETIISVPAAALEAVHSQSRSDQTSDDETPLPLQGPRSSTHSAWTGRRTRARARAVRPGSPSTSDERRATVDPKVRRSRYTTQEDDDDDDEGEIPLHMWERNGEILVRIPWFAGDKQRRV